MRTLLVFVGLFLGFSSFHASKGLNCDNITAEVVLTANSRNNTTDVTVNVKFGQEPIYYIFYKPEGDLLSKTFTENTVKGIVKGNYFCSIVDANGCKKRIDINIK